MIVEYYSNSNSMRVKYTIAITLIVECTITMTYDSLIYNNNENYNWIYNNINSWIYNSNKMIV